MSPTDSLLTLRDVSKVYRTDDVETTALDRIHLAVARGEFAAIMGPSGCGKSTLLNIVGMIDRPSGGSYVFDGEEIAGHPEAKLCPIRKRHVGFIFQSFNLIDELTVAENIELPLLYQRISPKERRTRVEAVMDQVGIAHRAKHRPQQLSGGQQQRVSVARAVVARPSLVLADEPTGNLDSAHGEEILRLLRALNEAGTTVLMVTHSASHADHAHRVIHLLDGRLLVDRVRAA